MIRKLTANNSKFHEIEFKKGLNAIVAERSDKSTKTDTRNGLGKTTLIEILHYCLGSQTTDIQFLRDCPELSNWSFSLEFDVFDDTINVTREIKNSSDIIIKGNTQSWGLIPKNPNYTYSNAIIYDLKSWRNILGNAFFDLPLNDENSVIKYRNLVNFFIRKSPSAFIDPFESHRFNTNFEKNIHNTYLLKLNWEDSIEISIINKRIAELQNNIKLFLKISSEKGLKSIGEIDSEIIKLNEKIIRDSHNLKRFSLNSKYSENQEKINNLTKEIHSYINKRTINNEYLKLYASNLEDETIISSEMVIDFYKQTKILLPELIIKTLQDAENFHKQINSYRTDFIKTEVERLNAENLYFSEEIHKKDFQRSEIMEFLEDNDALNEFHESSKNNVTVQRCSQNLLFKKEFQ